MKSLNMKVLRNNSDNEKYRIKPRKKYGRQVWLLNGKAIIVDPVDTEDDNGKEE